MFEIQYMRFAVDETPYCIWDYDVPRHNRDFINSIDPRYFEHVAKIHGSLLTGEERQYAAIALRTAYSHSLETLFALICATIQAYECVFAWFLKYQNRDLIALVRKINEYRPIKSRISLDPVSWETISTAVHAFNTGDTEKDSRIRQSFADLWARFADDFLDEKLTREYNSIKHGLRVSIGGFTLSMGAEYIPGVPAPPERMRSFGGSEFGTSFFVPEQLHNRHNLRVMRQRLNWSPENYIWALQLVSMSIQNIITYLKIVSGVNPSEVRFTWPIDESHFDEPWKRGFSMSSFGTKPMIPEHLITPLTPEEILKVYEDEQQESGDSTDQSSSE